MFISDSLTARGSPFIHFYRLFKALNFNTICSYAVLLFFYLLNFYFLLLYFLYNYANIYKIV